MSESKSSTSGSNIQRYQVQDFLVIGRWVAQMVGNGNSIRVGEDPWVWGDGIQFLSQDIRDWLKGWGFQFLEDVGQMGKKKMDLDLGLVTALANEWQCFINSLFHNGYEALSFEYGVIYRECWNSTFWKWRCPLKVRLFLWLVMDKRILTWHNGKKSSQNGPNHCSLCKSQL